MRVAHRLYLTVLPAVLGVFVVAALAYWGQYAHRVPELLVAVAAIASIGTLVLAWVNARYVAQRVERLAATNTASAGPDELDTIEDVVDRLSSAVSIAELTKADREREVARAHDYATLMASVAEDVTKRIEEVRLPLYILLENHFGELNENQEEMLGAARAAADVADGEVIAMQRLADLDRGAQSLRNDRILPGDLLKSLLPTLQAQAEKRRATLHVDIEPLVPAIRGDQPRLQEALSTLLGAAIDQSAAVEMGLTLAKERDGCVIVLTGVGKLPRNVRTALANRLVAAMGGRIDRSSSQLSIELGRVTA